MNLTRVTMKHLRFNARRSPTCTRFIRPFSIDKSAYVSTRGYPDTLKDPEGQEKLNFLDVVRKGLAPDRGLFVAREFHPFYSGTLEDMIRLDYQRRALQVFDHFPISDMVRDDLKLMIYKAYSSFSHAEVLPVTHLENNHYLMETFHGPTGSFKDLSLQLTPKILNHSVKLHNASQADHTKKMTLGLLVATSGDTGTAALDGFGREGDIPVVVLYPKDGVSIVQKLQMMTAAGSCLVLGVDGDFDFCQTTVKDILNSNELAEDFARIVPNLKLSSANSINWGRFLPQVAFTVSSYLDMVKSGSINFGDTVDICIPTGNFGNILGTIYAKKLGIPIGRIISASNVNNVICDFIKTGEYDLTGRSFQKTNSPAIDILVSSNVERFLHLLSGQNHEEIAKYFKDLAETGKFTVDADLLANIQSEVEAGWCDEADCLKTIKDVFERTQVLIDPHTAVAKKVADEYTAKYGDERPLLISATAHFSKFPDAMLDAFDIPYEADDDFTSMLDKLMDLKPKNMLHQDVQRLATLPVLHDRTCAADPDVIIKEIKTFLADFASSRH